MRNVACCEIMIPSKSNYFDHAARVRTSSLDEFTLPVAGVPSSLLWLVRLLLLGEGRLLLLLQLLLLNECSWPWLLLMKERGGVITQTYLRSSTKHRRRGRSSPWNGGHLYKSCRRSTHARRMQAGRVNIV